MDKKEAVALRYNHLKDNAPKVVAKGKGLVAENILELAKKNGIPIKNDLELLQILSKLEVDEEIPVKLYKAVAKILAIVYQSKKERR